MERISTAEIFRNSLASIQRQQVDVQRLQEQIATGERLRRPADDPIGSAQVLRIDSALDATRQHARNADFARGRLEREEGSLQAVGESLQRVRELVVRGANDTQSTANRRTIALEIRQELDAVLTEANATGPEGDYLFAGNRVDVRPFAASGGSIVYNGDDGQRFAEIGPGEQVAVGDSGRDVFLAAPAGNGTFAVDADVANTGSGTIATGSVVDPAAYLPDDYSVEFTAPDTFDVRDGGGNLVAGGVAYTAGEAITAIPGIEFTIDGVPAAGDRFRVASPGSADLFSTLRESAAAMESAAASPADKAQFRTDVDRALTALQGAIDHISDRRAEVGTRLERIERQERTNGDLELSLESRRSRIADADIVAAASELRLQLTSLQAAQQSFARVQDLSLLDFI